MLRDLHPPTHLETVWPIYRPIVVAPAPVLPRPQVDPNWTISQIPVDGWISIQDLATKTGMRMTTVSQQVYRAYDRGELERESLPPMRRRGRIGHRYRRKP
jgi:hypothetical protein